MRTRSLPLAFACFALCFSVVSGAEPTKLSITLLTPPYKLIAGDTLLFELQIANTDGPIPGAYCFGANSGNAPLVVQDTLWNGSSQPVPVVIADNQVCEVNTYPSSGKSIPVCFENGLDTIKVVLYYAPYDADSLHRLTVTLGTLTAQTTPFKLLPRTAAEPVSLEIVLGNDTPMPDTIRLTYSDGFMVIYARARDHFGNQIGFLNCDWSTTGTLRPLTDAVNTMRILYETETAVQSEAGFIVARRGQFTDSVYVVILSGPTFPVMQMSLTADLDANGYIDAVDLQFDRRASRNLATGTTVRRGSTAFAIDSVSELSERVLRLHIREEIGVTFQTGWSLYVEIPGSDSTSLHQTSTTNDGAAPVIASVVKLTANNFDESTDTVCITFSEEDCGGYERFHNSNL